jgi:mono/diheme cytochrome c family protein
MWYLADMITKGIRKTFMLGIAAMVLQAPPQSVWDGVYTDDQATRGEATFNKTCVACHDLKGEMMGDAFMNTWKGQKAFDLYDKIKNEMPMDNPGSLTPQTSVDIVSFLFKSNAFPSGKSELEAKDDTLKQIKIEPKSR